MPFVWYRSRGLKTKIKNKCWISECLSQTAERRNGIVKISTWKFQYIDIILLFREKISEVFNRFSFVGIFPSLYYSWSSYKNSRTTCSFKILWIHYSSLAADVNYPLSSFKFSGHGFHHETVESPLKPQRLAVYRLAVFCSTSARHGPTQPPRSIAASRTRQGRTVSGRLYDVGSTWRLVELPFGIEIAHNS